MKQALQGGRATLSTKKYVQHRDRKSKQKIWNEKNLRVVPDATNGTRADHSAAFPSRGQVMPRGEQGK